VIQGLFADPVASQPEGLVMSIPEGECEHPDELRQGRGHSPLSDGGEEHLRVGMAAESMAEARQVLAEWVVVVDLSVVRDDVPTLRRAHRLVAVRRQVDDGEASVAESDPAPLVDPTTAVVRSPVRDR
jgi:hypothetical protein